MHSALYNTSLFLAPFYNVTPACMCRTYFVDGCPMADPEKDQRKMSAALNGARAHWRVGLP